MGPGRQSFRVLVRTRRTFLALAAQTTRSIRAETPIRGLVTERLIKAVFAKKESPYSDDALASIATNCTLKEDAARKVERAMQKR